MSEQDFGRTPPHDIAAEMATLGGMLLLAVTPQCGRSRDPRGRPITTTPPTRSSTR